MMIQATSVEDYLRQVPDDRREVISAIRQTVLANLPKGYEEGIQYNGIGYYVPHTIYPAGYHCDPKQPLPFMGIANQKNHIGIYLFCIYGGGEMQNKFVEAWKATGKKLEMGAACVRVKKLEDVAFNVLGDLIAEATVEKFVKRYEELLAGSKKSRKK